MIKQLHFHEVKYIIKIDFIFSFIPFLMYLPQHLKLHMWRLPRWSSETRSDMPLWRLKIPHDSTKTQCSQINKHFKSNNKIKIKLPMWLALSSHWIALLEKYLAHSRHPKHTSCLNRGMKQQEKVGNEASTFNVQSGSGSHRPRTPRGRQWTCRGHAEWTKVSWTSREGEGELQSHCHGRISVGLTVS